MKKEETAVLVHPYVTKTPGIQGGAACIKGTRMTVAGLWARYDLHGQSPREITAQFPNLTLAQILDALSYAAEYQAEILEQLDKESDLYPTESSP
jgi:uncharacterized protein (DUF433 family)